MKLKITKSPVMVLLVSAMLLSFMAVSAYGEEEVGVFSASAPSSIGQWSFYSAGMPFSIHSLEEDGNLDLIDMPIGTWYAFNSESELPGSFIFSTRIAAYDDLSRVAISSVAPNGTANASAFQAVTSEDGVEMLRFESDGFSAVFFSGLYADEENEVHLIRDGENMVPMPSYAAEGFSVSLVHINPSFSAVMPTSVGNYTINSSLPIVVLGPEEANNTDFYNLSSYAWYVFEGADEAGVRYIDCINPIDVPDVSGGLPDFSKLNIEVTAPGNDSVPGICSSASNFSAFVSETGEPMLDMESMNFTQVLLFNDDGSSRGSFALDGNPIPLGNFTGSRTHLVLVRQI